MVLDNLRNIRRRIETASRRRGRDSKVVELVAVTKQAAPEDVREILRSGEIHYLGENRIQEAAKRCEALGPEARLASWRFIGHLQTNKIRQALELFDWIDSVDSLRLARALDAHLKKSDSRKKILVQVKLTDRATQSGVAPENLGDFLVQLTKFGSLAPHGLMAIAPWLEPMEAVRPYFRRMKELLDRHFPAAGQEGERPCLSMGMSRDFEIAVEEGSNMVRIGTALFGR